MSVLDHSFFTFDATDDAKTHMSKYFKKKFTGKGHVLGSGDEGAGGSQVMLSGKRKCETQCRGDVSRKAAGITMRS